MQAELSIPSLRENENPILQKFDADLLWFDLADNGRIIASRAPHARTRQGESFWDLVDPQERQSVKDYLLSYEAAPLVIRTSLGIAILFGDSVPHVSLAAALLPHMEQSTLLRVLEKLPDPSLLGPSDFQRRASPRGLSPPKTIFPSLPRFCTRSRLSRIRRIFLRGSYLAPLI